MESKSFIRGVEEATGSHYRPGNRLTILQNGDEIFPSMLDAIKGANTNIEFLTYVYWKSHIGEAFAEALRERARAGVKVRVLVDAIGGAIMDTRTVWRLEQAGVQIVWFRPVRWPYLHKFNNRTHRKILIADGRVGFTGGVGIADHWTGSAQDEHHIRETHCRIEGPACADLFAGFAENWYEATGERLAPLAPIQPVGDVAIHTTISTARVRPTKIQRLIDTVFSAARKNLWITSAYFVPSPEVVGALCAAAGRGVDVRVLTNGSLTDYKVTLFAARSTYGSLLESGVKVYEYQKTMHHAKIITVDGAWATLGSANLDNRSLVLNDELNISVTDKDIVTTLNRQFLEDLSCARQIDPAQWPQRRLADRVAEASSWLLWRQL